MCEKFSQSQNWIISHKHSIWKTPNIFWKRPPNSIEGHSKNLCLNSLFNTTRRWWPIFTSKNAVNFVDRDRLSGYPKRAIPVGGVLPRLKELRDVTTWVDGSKHYPTVMLDRLVGSHLLSNSRENIIWYLYSIVTDFPVIYVLCIHMLWQVPGTNLAFCPTS